MKYHNFVILLFSHRYSCFTFARYNIYIYIYQFLNSCLKFVRAIIGKSNSNNPSVYAHVVHVRHVCERFPCGRLAKQFDKVSQTRCNYFIKQWNAIPPFSLQLSRRTKSYGCWFLLPHHATTSYNSLIHVVNFSRRLFSPIFTRVFPFLS